MGACDFTEYVAQFRRDADDVSDGRLRKVVGAMVSRERVYRLVLPQPPATIRFGRPA